MTVERHLIYYLIFLLVAICGSCKESSDTHTTADARSTDSCFAMMSAARKDLNAGILKYYTLGMVPPTAEFIYNLNKRNIELVHMGCTRQPAYNCYNAIADSLLSYPSAAQRRH